MSTAVSEKPNTKTKAKVPETIYVDDPDGKKFYEMVDHDAMTLQETDLLVFNGVLRQVKKVNKKTVRGGVVWTITLDTGFQFDPRDDSVPQISPNMRSIRYWRPRKGF